MSKQHFIKEVAYLVFPMNPTNRLEKDATSCVATFYKPWIIVMKQAFCFFQDIDCSPVLTPWPRLSFLMSRFFGTMFLIFKNKFDAAVKSFQQWIFPKNHPPKFQKFHHHSRLHHGFFQDHHQRFSSFRFEVTQIPLGRPGRFKFLVYFLGLEMDTTWKVVDQHGYFSATCTNHYYMGGS